VASKQKPQGPPPIDRPLSKAYLRKFGGWSTAYPPGLSEPTSLRILENMQVTREGAVAVRPALRSILTSDQWLTTNFQSTMVGGFEHFFLNDGRKAFLFATRLSSGVVAFKVASENAATKRYDVGSLAQAGFSVPQGETTLNFSSATTFVKYLQIDNKIFALSDGGEALRLFNVGTTKVAKRITAISRPSWTGGDALTIRHPDAAWINGTSKVTIPAAETATTATLISSSSSANEYSYGFFYTFENEVGESAASQVKILRAAKPWSQWRFIEPGAAGEETSTSVTDPAMAMDQLVAIIPDAAFTAALAQGATKWNLYMFTWSNQGAVPPEGIMVASRPLSSSSTKDKDSWLQCTAAISVNSGTAVLPTEANRFNFSDPSNAGQGLVAGDRLILANDRSNGALIRWTSNQISEYTNFSPSKGGGQKTLTSGNLNIPVSIKLWQNPQSVDTITILCTGVDGYSTSYYMAPAEVSGQSSSTTIMGFEETTATPGTVSPYGVEVLNNALYHPLDTMLMKSTAANYNINHTPITDDIANKWTELLNKQNIISSQHDNRLYYLVHNPDGAALEENCKGNEIWVYDGAKDAGSWSRWLVQGITMSKVEVSGKLYLGLARPEGIFVFDADKVTDDTAASGTTVQRPIPFKMETNTQGANRAHDAWAYLKQMNITLANWRGYLRYGLRGFDNNGLKVEVYKDYRSKEEGPYAPIPRMSPFDISDFLRIGRTLKEWYFFAENRTDGSGVLPGYGQVNYVQYGYTPASVNIGGEFGSVETFEYSRDVAGLPSTTFNGVPEPFFDSLQP
jgi:hypothetical protein